MTIDAPVSGKKVSAIQMFVKAGFALMPLNGKIPVIKDWPNVVKHGDYGVKELAHGNYGVVLPETVIVVDIDPRWFEKGDKPMTRLCADLGITKEQLNTLIVQTGGKGLHYYFMVPAGTKIVGKLKAYKGIDFKAVGGQVVGPGSIHPDTGAEYVLLSGDPASLLECPQTLLDALIKPETTLETNAGTSCYQEDEGSRARFVSFLETADPSIEGEAGDLQAYKTAAKGRDLALPPDITLELMLATWNDRCSPPWEADELAKKVKNAYAYAESPIGNAHPAASFTPLPMPPPLKDADIIWELNAQGFIKKSFVNLVNYLRSPSHGLSGIFGYNEFAGAVEIVNPAPWHDGKMPTHKPVSDHDLKLLKFHLASRCKIEMPLGTIEEAVVTVSNSNRFHPVREYLSSLKWDGTPRLDNWLRDYAGAADDEYTRACARKTLCAAVMRAFKPGCKYDHVLVLEGEQNIGKSSIVKILGGDWSADFTINPHDRDGIQLMQGAWIIEMAEMEVARRADMDALKAFITRQIDTARLAYGRLAQSFPRQQIFIATKNAGSDGTYLKDETGGRRFWPVALKPVGGQVNFAGLKAVRNQLFAEAVALVARPPVLDAAGNVLNPGGERLDMDTLELKTAAKNVVAARYAEHEWTERIAQWIEGLPPERDFIAGRDVFLDAMGGLDKQFDRKSSVAISNVMKALGWKNGTRRFGTRIARGYQRPDAVLGDLV